MKKTKMVSAILFVAIATAGVATAQTAPNDMIALYNITVKPGHADQFEEFLMKLKSAADEVGVEQTWGVAQITFGGPGGAYAIGLPFSKWGDMDAWTQAPQILIEAYGKEEGAKIYKSGTMAIQESSTTIGRYAKDISYNVDAVAPAAMIHVRVSQIHRDKQDGYRIFLQALNEAWKEAGDTRQVIRRTNVVGPSTVYTSARWIDSYADLESDSNIWELIAKAHGEIAARRLRVVLEESVAHSEVSIYAVRPDLSRPPPTSTSN